MNGYTRDAKRDLSPRAGTLVTRWHVDGAFAPASATRTPIPAEYPRAVRRA